jgi:hypothetical protein
MIHPHPSTHFDIASALEVNGFLRAYVAWADRLRLRVDGSRQMAKRQRRKPSIARQIKQAEKTGKTVTSITTPDGTTINFGETKPTDASNPWLDDLKVTKQ